MCSARNCVPPSLDVINVARGHIVNSVAMALDGLHPTSVALSPDGSKVYVARAADVASTAGELGHHRAARPVHALGLRPQRLVSCCVSD
jgi:hypothetical protein